MPPAPGIIASLVSGNPTMLDEPNTRRCVHKASSSPPPSAIEDTAEIVGTGSPARSRNVPRSLDKNSLVLNKFEKSISREETCEKQGCEAGC